MLPQRRNVPAFVVQFAVFVDHTTKNPLWLRTGEAHKGWTLQSVQGREAILERAGESVVLNLP